VNIDDYDVDVQLALQKFAVVVILCQISTSVQRVRLTLVTRYVTIMWEHSTVVATVDMSFTMTLNVWNKVSSDVNWCSSS